MFGFLATYHAAFGLSGSIVIDEGTNGLGIIGTGAARCGSNGVVVHAPTQISMRISGTYQSILPDGQVASVNWDDGGFQIDWPSGSEAGLCDTIISANSLSIDDGDSVDWDLHAMSEPDNDIGHGLGQDALGLEQCIARIYALFLKNRADSESTMIVGDSSTNEWDALLTSGSTLTLPADSFFCLISEEPNGLDVVSDNCNLKIESDGGDLNYSINLCATSN